mgnify:CR=1 FL=1
MTSEHKSDPAILPVNGWISEILKRNQRAKLNIDGDQQAKEQAEISQRVQERTSRRTSF